MAKQSVTTNQLKTVEERKVIYTVQQLSIVTEVVGLFLQKHDIKN